MQMNPQEQRSATQWLLREASADIPAAQRWDFLIAAHIAGQTAMGLHWQTHAAMLHQAWQERDAREMAGQVMRMALIPLGHAFKRLPLGNSGRSRISAFEPMQIAPVHRSLIEQALRASVHAHNSALA